MAFVKKIHPLGWGDMELSYLIKQGLDNAALYRAMGYKLKPRNGVPKAFRDKVEQLKQGQDLQS